MATLPPPEEIHPEHDQPTPENIDDWTEEQLDRWNEAQDQQLQSGVEERQAELAAEERETLDALREAVSDDEPDTETVSLGHADVDVKTRMSGDVEDKVQRVIDEAKKAKDNSDEMPDLERVKSDMLDAITELIVTGTADSGYTFDDREVWEAFWREEGSMGLFRIFEQVAEPARERMERLKSFRNDRGGDRRR